MCFKLNEFYEFCFIVEQYEHLKFQKWLLYNKARSPDKTVLYFWHPLPICIIQLPPSALGRFIAVAVRQRSVVSLRVSCNFA
jgi:hypothetical protein